MAVTSCPANWMLRPGGCTAIGAYSSSVVHRSSSFVPGRAGVTAPSFGSTGPPVTESRQHAAPMVAGREASVTAEINEGRGLVIRVSAYPYVETIERLVREIRSRGITLFAHIDHAANAALAGLEMPPAAVLIFGDPAIGTQVMIESPNFALELPSRVLIRTRRDGSVVVVHHDAVQLAAGYGIPQAAAQPLAGLTRIVDAALGSAGLTR